MIPVSSYWSGEQAQALEELVATYQVGGIYITRGGPVSQVQMMNRLQALARVPLMAGVSAEWGLAQTMDSTMSFPKPIALGAIGNDTLIYDLGQTVATQMKWLGLNINFAPRIDLYRKGLPYEFFTAITSRRRPPKHCTS